MDDYAARVDDASFKKYVNHLVRLDQMIAAGEGDSKEADSLRDVMETLWYQINPKELAIVRQLSADLYTLHDDPLVAHPKTSDIYSPELASLVHTAKEHSNYLEVLSLLQQRSSEISADRAASLRGLCYEKLGLIDISFAFLRKAAEVADDPSPMQAFLLAKFGKHRRIYEGIATAEQFLSHANIPSVDVQKMAANLYVDFANLHRRVGTLQEDVIRKAIKLCESVFEESRSDVARWKDSLDALSILSNCYLLLGERLGAIECESQAIILDPLNSTRFIVRGMIRWPLDSDAALLDFHRAIELGTQYAWPYYFLSLDAISAGEFALCIKFANSALQFATDLNLIAKLHEWIAISMLSQAESFTDVPIESIRQHFKSAMAFAPDSQHVLANYQAFEASLSNDAIDRRKASWQDIRFDKMQSVELDEIVGTELRIPQYAY